MKKIRGMMECVCCWENDEEYKVSASKRKDAADLMEGHYKKNHSQFTGKVTE